jgi:malonyl-CoA O-methyltransferase
MWVDRGCSGIAEEDGPPVVFLPGWGFDGRIITLADPPRSWIFPDFFLDPDSVPKMLLDHLRRRKIPRVQLVGWSMGGNLALDFARSYPERIAGLHLLSVRRHWPAMEIEAIRAALDADPQSFMSSFYRKCFLGDKARYQLFVKQLQEEYLGALDLSVLHRGLDYLENPRAVVPVSNPVGEVFCLHGGKDIIAPVEEMLLVEGAQRQVYGQAGHTFFLGKDMVFPWQVRKNFIRRRFSRAAGTYDSDAGVQKELARRLADALPAAGNFETVLEIGCGTGNFTEALRAQYPAADIVAVDFSEKMLQVAREKLAGTENLHFVCEDGERFLAGGKKSFDLIASNATLQWFDDLDGAFFHARRLLSPTGCFRATIFGPRTLAELARGLQCVSDGAIRIPAGSFPDADHLYQTLRKHFTTVRIEPWQLLKEYGSIHDLLIPLARTGTTGWHAAGSPRLTREMLQQLDQWFLAEYGSHRVTYQAFILRCEP